MKAKSDAISSRISNVKRHERRPGTFSDFFQRQLYQKNNSFKLK